MSREEAEGIYEEQLGVHVNMHHAQLCWKAIIECLLWLRFTSRAAAPPNRVDKGLGDLKLKNGTLV